MIHLSLWATSTKRQGPTGRNRFRKPFNTNSGSGARDNLRASLLALAREVDALGSFHENAQPIFEDSRKSPCSGYENLFYSQLHTNIARARPVPTSKMRFRVFGGLR